jgi:hypothetical protein
MTTVKARKGKPTPAPEPPIEWQRADPAALAKFDPTTKTCTMTCGKHAHDPRSYKELKFMCDDCDCHAAPRESKGTPAMPMIDSDLFAAQLAKVSAARDAMLELRRTPHASREASAMTRWRAALDAAENEYHVEAGTLSVLVQYEVEQAAARK